jgi:hypothetical protein
MVAISGTAKNAPASHHILDQNIRANSIIKLLRLSRFHIIFGSKIFPDINCGINKQANNTKEVTLESNTAKL